MVFTKLWLNNLEKQKLKWLFNHQINVQKNMFSYKRFIYIINLP